MSTTPKNASADPDQLISDPLQRQLDDALRTETATDPLRKSALGRTTPLDRASVKAKWGRTLPFVMKRNDRVFTHTRRVWETTLELKTI